MELLYAFRKVTYTLNRFYLPEHCSTQLRDLEITIQPRWNNAGTIAKEVELRYIHVINRFITIITINIIINYYYYCYYLLLLLILLLLLLSLLLFTCASRVLSIEFLDKHCSTDFNSVSFVKS